MFCDGYEKLCENLKCIFPRMRKKKWTEYDSRMRSRETTRSKACHYTLLQDGLCTHPPLLLSIQLQHSALESDRTSCFNRTRHSARYSPSIHPSASEIVRGAMRLCPAASVHFRQEPPAPHSLIRCLVSRDSFTLPKNPRAPLDVHPPRCLFGFFTSLTLSVLTYTTPMKYSG